MKRKKRIPTNYEGRYLGRLTPSTTIRFGSGLIGMGAGAALGGGVGAIGGFVLGDQTAKQGLKYLFKRKKRR